MKSIIAIQKHIKYAMTQCMVFGKVVENQCAYYMLKSKLKNKIMALLYIKVVIARASHAIPIISKLLALCTLPFLEYS